MLHERISYDYWEKLFDLEVLRGPVRHLPKTAWPRASSVTSPYHLAVNEQLRSEAIQNITSVQSVPADIFVFNLGEPDNRALTKVGGLPYRQANKKWPENKSGKPMTFVSQVCFVDSKDLIPTLPGDILLIFGDGNEYGFDWDMDYSGHSAPVFEWIKIGTQGLVGHQEIPETDWKITPCYGSIYRTHDYPELDPFAYEDISDVIPVVMSATKIGGMPTWIQNNEELQGGFLCAIASVFPEVNIPYPFLNHQEPITYYQQCDMDLLMWGDVGTMYLFWDGKQIRWTIQGH